MVYPSKLFFYKNYHGVTFKGGGGKKLNFRGELNFKGGAEQFPVSKNASE